MTNAFHRSPVTELCKAASTIQASFRNHMKSKHDGEHQQASKESGEHSKPGHDKVSKQNYFDIKRILNRTLKIAMMHDE